MFKHLTLLLFCTIIVSPLIAQTSFNAKGGINLSRLSSDPMDTNTEARIGFQVGADVRFGDRFKFIPGLYYIKYGNQIQNLDMVNGSVLLEDDVRIQALRAPLLGAVRLLGLEVLNLHIKGGFAATWVTAVDDNNLNLDKEDYEAFIFGGIVGVGLDVAIFTIDLDYEIGLSDVFKTDAEDVRNNMLSLSVGLLF